MRVRPAVESVRAGAGDDRPDGQNGGTLREQARARSRRRAAAERPERRRQREGQATEGGAPGAHTPLERGAVRTGACVRAERSGLGARELAVESA